MLVRSLHESCPPCSWLIFDVWATSMKNIATILGLLFGGFALACLSGAGYTKAGQVGIAAVFAFTALGHFVKQDEMLAMLPPFLPARRALVILSGGLELLFAAGVLLSAFTKVTGVVICCFLIIVTPLNIYSALRRVNFGGHAAGPKYLLVRLPLQVLLLVWTYWFAVRSR